MIAPPPHTHTHTHNTPQQQRSYADVTKSHEHQVEDTATTLKKRSRRIQRTIYTTTPTK